MQQHFWIKSLQLCCVYVAIKICLDSLKDTLPSSCPPQKPPPILVTRCYISLVIYSEELPTLARC